MKRSTHLAIGAAVAAPLVLSQGPGAAALSVGVCLCGSILPDWLDFQSGFRRPVKIRHRGVSHSLVALAICVGAMWALLTFAAQNPVTAGGLTLRLPGDVPDTLAVAIGLGYASHLIADACTPAGIQPFLPLLPRKTWLLPRRMRGRTGGLLDALTRWVALTVASFALVLAAGRWLDLLG